MADKLPRGSLRAAAEALEDRPDYCLLDPWEAARIALEAALPLIERDVRRQTGRRVLALDSLNRQKTRNRPPWIDLRTSLRKLSRGEELPTEQAVREQLSEVARG